MSSPTLTAAPPESPTGLSPSARYLILACAFLGWMFAGTQMSITPLMSRSSTIEMLWPSQIGQKLTKAQDAIAGEWFSWHNAAFLLGAASGGLLFGWLGDQRGRARAMGLSIVCYTLFTTLCYFVTEPEQLLVLRFIACLGVGGMWPNGIALASEAWSDVSRPTLAGVIGTAANVGIVLMFMATIQFPITPDNWRIAMLVGGAPLPLGLFVLYVLPESPRWLAERNQPKTTSKVPVAEVFRPPMLWLTLLGIALSTVPLFGGWGSGNWLIPWADQVGAFSDPALKSWTGVWRSLGGTVGSLLGGWMASLMGRRMSYFAISICALAISEFIYLSLTPLDSRFMPAVCMLGVASGLYFGWMPLCLPEMFPTRVRSTGGGVTFNFGRVLSAIGVYAAGFLIAKNADFGQVGQITSLIYALGIVVILFAPDTSQKKISD
jgi:sugar phosphate permease